MFPAQRFQGNEDVLAVLRQNELLHHTLSTVRPSVARLIFRDLDVLTDLLDVAHELRELNLTIEEAIHLRVHHHGPRCPLPLIHLIMAKGVQADTC